MSSFDEKAATWDDDPAKVERARAVAESIRAAVPLSPSTRLLEYGAGTALVSQALADHVGAITVADPSEGMRTVMKAKVSDGRLPETTRIWDLDLGRDDVPEERFDLVATVMTLHHIADLGPVLAAFAEILVDGGHLCVVDLVAEDGSFHSDGDFHGHHGFDTDELGDRLRAAGFTDVRVAEVYEVVKDSGRYPLFLATGTKAG